MQCSAADYERGGGVRRRRKRRMMLSKNGSRKMVYGNGGEEKSGKGHLGNVVRRHMPVWTELEVYEG